MSRDTSVGAGVAAGLLGAICFGFIPVFGKPALEQGVSPMCILAYRFTLAAIVLGLFLKVRRVNLGIPLRDIPTMLLLAVYYCVSGGCLMLGYEYMSGGVTGVIHFSYPVFVLLIPVPAFTASACLAVMPLSYREPTVPKGYSWWCCREWAMQPISSALAKDAPNNMIHCISPFGYWFSQLRHLLRWPGQGESLCLSPTP